jgi:hypothetical protein
MQANRIENIFNKIIAEMFPNLEKERVIQVQEAFRTSNTTGRWWHMPIILATQEAEIRRITVQSQPRQIICETLSQKPITKRNGGVAQGVGPEFKPQYSKKKERKKIQIGKIRKRNTSRRYS